MATLICDAVLLLDGKPRDSDDNAREADDDDGREWIGIKFMSIGQLLRGTFDLTFGSSIVSSNLFWISIIRINMICVVIKIIISFVIITKDLHVKCFLFVCSIVDSNKFSLSILLL